MTQIPMVTYIPRRSALLIHVHQHHPTYYVSRTLELEAFSDDNTIMKAIANSQSS